MSLNLTGLANLTNTANLNALYGTAALRSSGKTATTAAAAPAISTISAAALSASTSTISAEARARYASDTSSTPAASAPSTPSTLRLGTDLGDRELNMDSYFTQPTFSANNPLPLILPTAANVKALAADVSSKMPAFLAQAGIPSAPASISYDAEGQLTLPADYPYAAQFKAALDSAPAFSHEIAALNGIASQAADLIRMAPAQAALEKATTDAEAQAILQQYGMKEGHHSPLITLLFDANAQLSISADGKAVPDFA